jgi:branched-subunit amino acid ABC-type transport system permease component
MDIFIYGLVTGSILLICALGFSMTLKTEGFINVAHGQMLMLGAYFALGLTYLGLPFLISAFLSVILCGLSGIAFQRLLFKPIKSSGILVQLFTSVGLAYLINGLVGAIAGKRMLSFDIPISRVVKIGDVYLVTPYEFMILGIVLATVIFLHVFLQYTLMGKHIRAVADNQDLAKIRGINPDKCSDLVWFIASSLAGLGGIFLGILGAVHLNMGWQQIVMILSVTVLGGLGSIYGVMLAGLLLGFAMEFGLIFVSSNYRTGIAFGVIILVLVIRPQGLQSLWQSKGRET